MSGLTGFFTLLLALLPISQPVHGEEEHVHITVSNGYRYIVSDGLPNHETGAFPNRNNPNSIQLQYHRYRVPETPTPAAKSRPYFLMPFGIALNGIPFDPGAAEFWNGDRDWQYEALKGVVNLGLDRNNAHVQPTGAYHYHGEPTGLIETLDPKRDMLMLGYAADGFPIYADRGYKDPDDPASEQVTLKSSYRVKAGDRSGGPGGKYDGAFVQDFEYVAGSGDLDECNGRFGRTPEYPDGTYYYVITEDFPFIPRRFRGTPDESFERKGPPPGGRGGDRGGAQRRGGPRGDGPRGAGPGGFGPPPPGQGPPPPGRDSGFGRPPRR